MEDALYDIDELARLAGVTTRTVHFYAAQGLLPRVGRGGRGKRYAQGHLLRLRLIRRLQDLRMSLGEILTHLSSLRTDEHVREALERAPAPPAASAPTRALDYVRDVLASLPGTSKEGAAPSRRERPAWVAGPGQGTAPRAPRDRSDALPAAQPPPAPAPRGRGASAPPATQWERVAVTPYLEIHVRRPAGGPEEQRKVRRLLEEARRLFEGEPAHDDDPRL